MFIFPIKIGKFLNLVARWPGSTHDSHIFRASRVSQHLQQRHTSLEDGLLIGDSGYGLKPYLMVPYANPITANQCSFNRSLKKTRVVIEQVFGRWKRFHILHSEIMQNASINGLQCDWGCGVLHNIAVMFNEPFEDDVSTRMNRIYSCIRRTRRGETCQRQYCKYVFLISHFWHAPLVIDVL